MTDEQIAERDWLRAGIRLHEDTWQQLRDAYLSDPDHDNDTINWALDVFDSIAPEIREAAQAENDG